MAIGAVAGNDPADHRRRIFAGAVEKRGDHRARGGFAVASGHSNGGLLIDQGSQQVGSVPDRQLAFARFDQLRIAVRDGAADHHQRC